MSTVFFQGAPLLPYEADTNLLSSDGVIFCVHSAAILAKSNNGFASLLTPNRNASTGPSTSRNDHPLVRVTEPFATINIVLHTVYDISCAPFAPQVPALTAAIKALIKYGISLHAHIAPGTPLFVVLAAHIPGHALELYALAAEHDLYELARPASTHLIGRRLVDIPEAAVVQMGPLYLKQILALKQGRLSALKALLAEPPDAHPYTATCDESKQQNLRNAWTLASAYLIWEMRPGRSPPRCACSRQTRR